VVINNFNNINKMNNHINSLDTKKTMTYDVGNPGPGLGKAQTCAADRPVKGIPALSS